ncbi:MAG TPA: mechanosensitive ion channel family protein [Solirubrobacteraceae bacterium]|jgi:small-conductance mechanosensitive channel|nr:mechanosensitive ion channel family protein [Solirubrobacteraceae bacterium]
MFETHSEEWERVGLAVDGNQKGVSTARRRAAVLILAFIAVVVVYNNYRSWFGVHPGSTVTTVIQIAAVVTLLGLGWAIARDIGRIAGPTFFRRMDPGTAGTVGFLVRLVTVVITVVVALDVAGLSAGSLVATSAFTAVILGLAAQQTLGNLFAGMVLLSARPFRVGERVRFQAGAVGGQIEGIVSSLGLLYTTLVQGDDRIMVPNNVVLSAVVVPIREPESVDVKVRLGKGIPVTQVQKILDDGVETPTRRPVTVNLQELDGDDVIVRVQATPDRPDDGARLADEIIDALASVTGEHAVIADDGKHPAAANVGDEPTKEDDRSRAATPVGPRRR